MRSTGHLHTAQPIQMAMSDLLRYRPHAHLERHNPRLPVASHISGRSDNNRFKDVVQWQFWPRSVSMGTLMKEEFVQVS